MVSEELNDCGGAWRSEGGCGGGWKDRGVVVLSGGVRRLWR